MKSILLFLLGLIIFCAIFALGGLIYWGIGNLVIWAFKIDFNWTYWCGLALQFITVILAGIFRK